MQPHQSDRSCEGGTHGLFGVAPSAWLVHRHTHLRPDPDQGGSLAWHLRNIAGTARGQGGRGCGGDGHSPAEQPRAHGPPCPRPLLYQVHLGLNALPRSIESDSPAASHSPVWATAELSGRCHRVERADPQRCHYRDRCEAELTRQPGVWTVTGVVGLWTTSHNTSM